MVLKYLKSFELSWQNVCCVHGYLKIEPSWCSFLFFFSVEDKIFLTSFYVFVYSPHSVPYIAYYLRSTTFAVPCLYLHSQKNLRLPPFTSFHSIHMQKFAKKLPQLWSNRQKTCEFPPQIISNIWYWLRYTVTGIRSWKIITTVTGWLVTSQHLILMEPSIG